MVVSSDAKAENPDQLVLRVDEKVNVLTAHLSNNIAIRIEVSVDSYHPRYSGEAYQPDSWWGSLDAPPKTVVRSLKIKVNATSIELLPSTFDYLGNPARVVIVPMKHFFSIKVFGGDAGASYIATFEFREKKLKRRKVELAEFPNTIYEETQYVNKETDSGR